MHKGCVIRAVCCAIYVLYGVFLKKNTAQFYGRILCTQKEQKTCMRACIVGCYVFLFITDFIL